jgi:hypothetical protein
MARSDTISEDSILREMARDVPPKTDGRRIETFVRRLEEILKEERNKEGRLSVMVARTFGGGNQAKNESHAEPVPSGIIGQLESLLDKLSRSSERQSEHISSLEELL